TRAAVRDRDQATGSDHRRRRSGADRCEPGVSRRRRELRATTACRGQRQGGHQPAPVPVAAWTAAREASNDRCRRACPAAGRAAQGPAPGSGNDEQGSPIAWLGDGRCARAGGAAGRAGGAAMTVLCLMEVDAEGGAADASVRALSVATALARSGGEELAAVWFGPAETIGDAVLTGAGVDTAYRVRSAALPGYPPQAWARALAGLAAQSSLPAPVSAIVAAATDHGNEVLAHLAAITGQPMAANCISAERTGPGELSLVRQRWAGSLLEDAV